MIGSQVFQQFALDCRRGRAGDSNLDQQLLVPVPKPLPLLAGWGWPLPEGRTTSEKVPDITELHAYNAAQKRS